ncbi:hypothetical protein DSECCO2_464720 [anaerobic digester metagenome]
MQRVPEHLDEGGRYRLEPGSGARKEAEEERRADPLREAAHQEERVEAASFGHDETPGARGGSLARGTVEERLEGDVGALAVRLGIGTEPVERRARERAGVAPQGFAGTRVRARNLPAVDHDLAHGTRIEDRPVGGVVLSRLTGTGRSGTARLPAPLCLFHHNCLVPRRHRDLRLPDTGRGGESAQKGPDLRLIE